jgi:hypothetical protein
LAHIIAQRSNAMPKDNKLEPLLIKHADAMQLIGCKVSFYWALVRTGQITVVGKGHAGRAYVPSVRAYVEQLLAEAQSAMAANGGRRNLQRSAQMRAIWATKKANQGIAAE